MEKNENTKSWKKFFLFISYPVVVIYAFYNYSLAVGLSVLYSPCIYTLRPRYFPCEGWKKVAVCWIVLCLVVAEFCVFSEWVDKEEISSLQKIEGTLDYYWFHTAKGRPYKSFHVSNEKQFKTPSFALCDIDLSEYESKNVTIWYNKNDYVYQMQVGDEIVANIDDANKKVDDLNWWHFNFSWMFFIIITMICLRWLYDLNNGYKKI
jgi:hypothetical protein